MRLAGFKPTSLFDGFGINFVIFFQGCKHQCVGCHNPTTWDLSGGIYWSFDNVTAEIMKYRPLITGITLSGGDPLFQKEDALKLANWAKNHNLQTTLYTGFNLTELFPECCDWNFDYIIDGKFIQSCKSLHYPFRGSSNQIIWKKTNCGFENIEAGGNTA